MRQGGKLGGAHWAATVAVVACLDFGLASCQDKGSGVMGVGEGEWQKLYVALSEEDRAKVGVGLRSVVALGLSKETIVGSVFDGRYATETDIGGEPLFYVLVVVDKTGGLDELRELGIELEPLVGEGARFALKATFAQVMAVVKAKEVLAVEAETDWGRALRTLTAEERQKLGFGFPDVIDIGSSGIPESHKKMIFAGVYGADTSGVEPLFWVRVTARERSAEFATLLEKLAGRRGRWGRVDGDAFAIQATFVQIMQAAKLPDAVRIDLGRRFGPLD